MVAILSVTGTLVVVALNVAEAGLREQVGGSFAGRGETLHVKLTVPAKPAVPVTVIVDVPI